MRRIVITVFMATLSCWAADIDPAMTKADLAFLQAFAKSDKALLEKLLDSDFTWTDAAGKTATKAEILENLPKPGLANEPSAEGKSYEYGAVGDVQTNLGRYHSLRVWVKRPEGWKALVYQEVMSLEAPPTSTPGAGKDCENPCKTVSYTPENEVERQVIAAYSRLETAAMAHDSAVFATVAADEFIAASSNSNKIYNKKARIEDFNHSKMGGVAPTPLISARLFVFGDAVVMRSEHRPDRGNPLHVTRVWVKRNGNWMETLSYQTSVKASTAP
jgi:hypothetical protein